MINTSSFGIPGHDITHTILFELIQSWKLQQVQTWTLNIEVKSPKAAFASVLITQLSIWKKNNSNEEHYNCLQRIRILPDFSAEQKNMEIHLTVPFLSVAFDLAHAIHLNPRARIPAASTIRHGWAWLQETLQLCLHFNSVHIVHTGRPLHRRLIQLSEDTPTHLLGAHPSTGTIHLQ